LPQDSQIARIDPAREREQVAELRAFRAGRDAVAATAAIAEVISTAKGSANMMPSILAAVKAGCTVGEISAALRSVWGEHREAMVL